MTHQREKLQKLFWYQKNTKENWQLHARIFTLSKKNCFFFTRKILLSLTANNSDNFFLFPVQACQDGNQPHNGRLNGCIALPGEQKAYKKEMPFDEDRHSIAAPEQPIDFSILAGRNDEKLRADQWQQIFKANMSAMAYAHGDFANQGVNPLHIQRLLSTIAARSIPLQAHVDALGFVTAMATGRQPKPARASEHLTMDPRLVQVPPLSGMNQAVAREPAEMIEKPWESPSERSVITPSTPSPRRTDSNEDARNVEPQPNLLFPAHLRTHRPNGFVMAAQQQALRTLTGMPDYPSQSCKSLHSLPIQAVMPSDPSHQSVNAQRLLEEWEADAARRMAEYEDKHLLQLQVNEATKTRRRGGSTTSSASNQTGQVNSDQHEKDAQYRQRREKNNVAAKKSREARKRKEMQTRIECEFLRKENKRLRAELVIQTSMTSSFLN